MSQTTAKGSGTTKNNGGTVMMGGNIGAKGPITQALGISSMGYHVGTHGWVPTSGDNIGATFIKSEGTYGKLTEGKYVGYGITSQLAGVANTALLNSGANRYGKPAFDGYRTLRGEMWDYVTGAVSGQTSYFDVAYSISAGGPASGGADNAQLPTRTVPGELTYLATGKTPTNDDYSEKTG